MEHRTFRDEPPWTTCELPYTVTDISAALATPSGRRWLRLTVLPRLSPAAAAELAEQLLAFREDFFAVRRDRSTWLVVQRLERTTLLEHAEWLAGSNAALALWERLGTEGLSVLVTVALRVLRRGTPQARETVLTLLVADPTREVVLPRWAKRALLMVALADPDAVVRGLAAETAATQLPELLLPAWRAWVRDQSQRVRRATWAVVLGRRSDAVPAAQELLTEEGAPAPVRADALWALGQTLSTSEFAPILAACIQHPARELAEVAAELLWTQHRHPLPAQAALKSPHASVQAIGEWLLHPQRGSPAAGGGRPGMPLPLV
uniref:HEAT repeat domain-containing protein n=1 Tax=Thermomicrobium roseum TaxID=500 RepID=A0A7C2BH04_THERO